MEMQTLIVEGPFPPSLLQPLLIARALAQQPDLLILDEALGALPYDRAKQVLESLRAEGKLVIFASHDPQMVALADKVLELGARPAAGDLGGILPAKA
jgi:ABC-type lipoprotein export system ATPase subunit